MPTIPKGHKLQVALGHENAAKAVQKHNSGIASRLYVVSTRKVKNKEHFVSGGSLDFAAHFAKKA